MTTSTVNYTPEMIAVLTAAAPINHEKAQALAVQLDRGVRSIIAKCKREGIETLASQHPLRKKRLQLRSIWSRLSWRQLVPITLTA